MIATMDAPVIAPGLHPDMPADVYHRDDALSASGVKLLLPPSCPAKYRHERDHGRPPKQAFEFGHAAHKRVLGVGEAVASIDCPDWRTKKAKDFAAQCREAGVVPLLAAEMAVVEEMEAALRATPLAAALLAPGSGRAELSGFWTDPPSGIRRRVRFDWLRHTQPGRRRIIADYKTCAAADEESLQKAFVNFGYHRQAAWYLDGAKALCGDDTDPVFVFICQEKTPPYLVNVVQPDPNAVRIGGIDNRHAIRVFAECQATGVWPGYCATDPNWLSLPTWIENREEYK